MIPLDFYNYFQHGIDFYISGNTHIVKKIVLQSNMVIHKALLDGYELILAAWVSTIPNVQAVQLGDRRKPGG